MPEIIGFDLQPRTRVVYGIDSIERLGTLAAAFPGTVLIVTDPGIAAAGHLDRALRTLSDRETVIFDQVRENPTTDDVDACVAAAEAAGVGLIVGLGGGSSLDTAKGCNFLLTNGGRMQDYWGVGKAKHPMLPLIAVPTTSGTGSECQSFALIADAQTHLKMACGDPKAAPRIALLDPTLTLSQPRGVTACTGIDAVSHAVETAVTNRRNELSLLYSREALRLTLGSLERVLECPDDLSARARMQLGAAHAGTAIENSMLGAAHAAANPLTAHFQVIHGHAVGLMLPHVVRFNAADPEAAAGYHAAVVAAGLAGPDMPPAEAAELLASRLSGLLTAAGLPQTLAGCGVTAESIPLLAREAAAQWTARMNPREVGAPDFEKLYTRAL
jgi:alcohol dehydrogenase